MSLPVTLATSSSQLHYYQVQGQMNVCDIAWVHFVVWFRPGDFFLERMFLDSSWWYEVALSKTDYF